MLSDIHIYTHLSGRTTELRNHDELKPYTSETASYLHRKRSIAFFYIRTHQPSQLVYGTGLIMDKLCTAPTIRVVSQLTVKYCHFELFNNKDSQNISNRTIMKKVISYNFTSFVVQSFRELPNLVTLILSNNRIHTIHRQVQSSFPTW